MRGAARSLLAALFFLGAPLGAEAAVAPAPLTLEEVSKSAARHYPAVLEGIAGLRAAEGDALAARGAFDLVFSAETSATLSGFYDGRIAGGKLTQPVAPLGGEISAGYRVSRGSFPIYRDEAFTNRGGEFKLGAYFSLLRDRAIDARRAKISDADIAYETAAIDLLMTRIGVQLRAQEAYWRWVAAGRQLQVYEELLGYAEAREKGLLSEVRSGARAEIFLTENRQNLTRRRIAAAEARREFETAANELSLFYRDDAGARIRPEPARLPPADGETATNIDGLGAAAEGALARRPELQRVDADLRRAELALALERNALKPYLNVSSEFSNDFGALGEGGASRDGAETVVGLRFETPLQARRARGGIDRAEARIEALRQRARGLRDEIEVELRNIALDLSFAAQLAQLSRVEVKQAEIMRSAERLRFRSGASDFFLLNIREEAAANARLRLHQADFRRASAFARFNAATIDLEALHLTGASPGAADGLVRRETN